MTKRIFYLPCYACLFKSFTKTTHRHISQEVRLFSSRGWFACFSLWETYLSGTRLQDPHPCSWPLQGGFFSFIHTAILVIVILLRLFTFIHHWHHIRARRIWLAYKVGPCAVFADMRSFISSLFVPNVTKRNFIFISSRDTVNYIFWQFDSHS